MNIYSSIANSGDGEGKQASSGVAIVTGSRGQDGSYLRDLIGYEHTLGCINPKHYTPNGISRNEISIDLSDKNKVLDLLSQIRPKSIFHLAAKHGPSTKMTYDREDILAMKRIHVDATRNFLESIEELSLDTHLVVAGSSRLFTPKDRITRVNELTEPNPSDYYGDSKLEAWDLLKRFRQELGLRASFLILFNHESPRRPPGYFSHDVSKAINDFRLGKTRTVQVRDAEFLGDWSDARDVTMLMAKTAASNIGSDFVVASGQLRSVREVVNSTLQELGHEGTEVVSLAAPDIKKRNFLEADNRKSIELNVWRQNIRIEQTIAEMANSSVQSGGK